MGTYPYAYRFPNSCTRKPNCTCLTCVETWTERCINCDAIVHPRNIHHNGWCDGCIKERIEFKELASISLKELNQINLSGGFVEQETL